MKNNGSITIKPFGGLANRMRVIASSYALAKKYHKTLKVLWEPSAELNCSFSKLFKSFSGFEIVDLKKASRIKHALSRRIEKYMALFEIYYPFDFRICPKVPKKRGGSIEYFVSEKKRIYICTGDAFYPSSDLYPEIFRPIDEVVKIAEEYTQRFNSNVVGIHIRRGDHKQAIENSPTELFIDVMRKMLFENPETFFYLSTDSSEVEQCLSNIFGPRIFVHKKTSLDRNVPEAIQDALVDMYTLSKTSKVVGSHFSSFSGAASMMGKTPLFIVKEGRDLIPFEK